jgi:hypothetical protein
MVFADTTAFSPQRQQILAPSGVPGILLYRLQISYAVSTHGFFSRVGLVCRRTPQARGGLIAWHFDPQKR